MNFFILTFWRFLYVVVLVVWSLSLSANEMSNRTEWNNVFANSTTAADNWVHVGSAIGLGCGSLVLLMALYGMACGTKTMTFKGSPKSERLQRIVFDFSCSLSSICIVSVSSIYLYVNRNLNKNADIAGMSWAVIFGGIFLAFSVVDSLMFKPTMAYIEFMSSFCVAKAVQPDKICQTSGQVEKGVTFLQRYLQGIVPLMPYLGTFGHRDMCFAGMPITCIILGPSEAQKASDEGWYKKAARALIEHLQTKYKLKDTAFELRSPAAGGLVENHLTSFC